MIKLEWRTRKAKQGVRGFAFYALSAPETSEAAHRAFMMLGTEARKHGKVKDTVIIILERRHLKSASARHRFSQSLWPSTATARNRALPGVLLIHYELR